MNQYEIIASKKKEALKQIVKKNLKDASAGLKLCYFLTVLMRAMAFAFGICTVLYVFLISKNTLDLLFLIITVGFPLGLSFLPATVYQVSLGREYRSRVKEMIEYTDEGFVYSYYDIRTGFDNILFLFRVRYHDIQSAHYDKTTMMLSIRGHIIGESYRGDALEEQNDYTELTLLNVYEVDLANMVLRNLKRQRGNLNG